MELKPKKDKIIIQGIEILIVPDGIETSGILQQ